MSWSSVPLEKASMKSMLRYDFAEKYKRRTVTELFAFYQIPKKFNDWLSPSKAKLLK